MIQAMENKRPKGNKTNRVITKGLGEAGRPLLSGITMDC
jgi:hypothetical protein